MKNQCIIGWPRRGEIDCNFCLSVHLWHFSFIPANITWITWIKTIQYSVYGSVLKLKLRESVAVDFDVRSVCSLSLVCCDCSLNNGRKCECLFSLILYVVMLYSVRYFVQLHFQTRFSNNVCRGHLEHSDSAGLQVNRSRNQSCTRGMIHNKIHFINPCCPWPNFSYTVQNHGIKYHLFLHIVLYDTNTLLCNSNILAILYRVDICHSNVLVVRP